MNTETPSGNRSGQLSESDLQQIMQEVSVLYADAPEMGKTALENVFRTVKSEKSSLMQAQAGLETESAGRVGLRQGTVSELTVIAPLVQGGGKRLRRLLELLGGNFNGADKVGTVHDMRFVFLENDTKLLFATAYDGNWDDYIVDFATKIPDSMDILFCNIEGWPGIHNAVAAKDFIAKYQLPAAAWYVANPNLTVVQARRLQRIDQALNDFLDKISE